ncbi:MAG: ATP-dependent Clp protease adaptor ClpS [Armatimonadota bacterium]|nr:ATP-dependent Clp protease adaptor ClpS [Armatimonadota bacterium]
MSAVLLPQTTQHPATGERVPGTGGDSYVVIVFNNDYNTFDEVIHILQVATGCSQEEAEMETWEIHNKGRSVVHHGTEEECNEAARIIRTIGVRVTVEEV